MRVKNDVRKAQIRYSEFFKKEVIRELETSEKTFESMRRKYGIRGKSTLQKWACQYGRGDLGKIIRVEKPKEINERQEMKRRIKVLETALADAHLDLIIERATTKEACRQAGIEDVDAFKKKVAGR